MKIAVYVVKMSRLLYLFSLYSKWTCPKTFIYSFYSIFVWSHKKK